MEYENERSWVRPYLEEGETILWTGKPARLHLLNKGDLFMIPFSLVWTALFLRVVIRLFRGGTFNGRLSAPFTFIPVIFAVVAVYLLIGRFIARAVQLRQSAYAVTTGKILVRRGKRVDLLLKRSLPPFSVQRYRDGTGTITFRQGGRYRYDGAASSTAGYSLDYGFALVGLEDVDRVLKLIQSADPGGPQY
jgi:hypothetical protein